MTFSTEVGQAGLSSRAYGDAGKVFDLASLTVRRQVVVFITRECTENYITIRICDGLSSAQNVVFFCLNLSCQLQYTIDNFALPCSDWFIHM